MKCELAAEQIVDDLTGDLSSAEAEALRVHLDTCDRCRAEAGRLRETWSDLGKLAVPEPGPAGLPGIAAQLAGRGRQTSATKRTPLAVAAVVVLALFAGYQVGRVTSAPVVGDERGQSEYLLLLREAGRVPDGTVTPNEEALVEEYRAWANSLVGQGRLVEAEKLTDDPGVWLAGPDGVRGRPDRGAWPTIGGYFVITAADRNAAVELARESPHLKYGGAIEVRSIDRP